MFIYHPVQADFCNKMEAILFKFAPNYYMLPVGIGYLSGSGFYALFKVSTTIENLGMIGHSNHNIWGFQFKPLECSTSVDIATAGGTILPSSEPSASFNIAMNKWKKFGSRCWEAEANEPYCSFVA